MAPSARVRKNPSGRRMSAGTILKGLRIKARGWREAPTPGNDDYIINNPEGVAYPAIGSRLCGILAVIGHGIDPPSLRRVQPRPGRRRGRVAVGRIRLCVVEDASAANLTSAVRECVEPASTIRTDGWPGYNDLQAEGYTHKVVRGESVMGDNLLPLAHRVASLLKRWMLGTHQGAVRPSHLPYYLDEFTLRFNRRTSRSSGKLFFRLVQQSVAVHPVTAEEIRGGREKTET
jgi:transposase-like protein